MRKKDKDAADAQDFTGMPAASAAVTPADIQSKEFNVSRFGGYRMRDVDEFLDQITESMTRLTDENQRLRSANGLPVAPSIGAPDLADTSRQADEIIESARAEAAKIVQDARAQAAVGTTAAGGRDRRRARRRRSVPRAGAGLPPAAGHPGPVARRVREGDGEGQPGEAGRRARRRHRPPARRRGRTGGAAATGAGRGAAGSRVRTRRSRCRRCKPAAEPPASGTSGAGPAAPIRVEEPATASVERRRLGR